MKKLLIYFFLMFNFVFAFEKVAIGFGQGTNSDIYNIAIQEEFDYKLIDSTDLIFEIALENVRSKNDSLSILSFQPMLSYDFTSNFYTQVGIGIAYFTNKELDDKRFGTSIQFKESIGFGYRFNQNIESSLKYVHYSNADMANENSGHDIGLLQFIYRF